MSAGATGRMHVPFERKVLRLHRLKKLRARLGVVLREMAFAHAIARGFVAGDCCGRASAAPGHNDGWLRAYCGG